MQKLTFTENEISGSTIVVPFTALKHLGPKHHAIVIGICESDQKIWIAELSRKHGYRLVSIDQWLKDNAGFLDGARMKPNDGPRSNWEVANSAIQEVISAHARGKKYDVLFNNCETFADRHRTGKTSLSPQVKKAVKAMGFVVAGGAFLLKQKFGKELGL